MVPILFFFYIQPALTNARKANLLAAIQAPVTHRYDGNV